MPSVPRAAMAGEVKTNLGRVGFNPKGEYAAGTTYKRLDIVQSDGSGWICLKDGTKGVKPVEGANWMRFADNGSATLLAEVKSSAAAAKKSEDAAKSSQTAADKSQKAAAKSQEVAEASAESAVAAETAAAGSAKAASDSVDKATAQANAAKGYADTAKQYADQTAAENPAITLGYDADGYLSAFEEE